MKNEEIKKIVVVDDTTSITLALGEWLKDEGIEEVSTFNDPVEAVKNIRENGKPDLIITDYDMPGMNGFELLDKIREDEKLNAIVMTADLTAIPKCKRKDEYEIIEKRQGFMEKIINKIKLLRKK